jgi:hypothetical protein
MESENAYRTGVLSAARSGLSRAAWHFVVDVLLLIAVLILTWTSAALQFVFPPPTRADGWRLWGRSYDTWSNVRFASLCTFLVIALLHVMLQWNWVCSFIATRVARLRGEKAAVPKAIRTIYGVATLIVILTLLGALLAAAEFTVRPPS